MFFKIAICDDNLTDALTIKKYLQNFEMNHDIDFDIHTFSNSQDFLNAYNSSGCYHIVFLDVEMPNKNGLEIARYIRTNLNDFYTKLVFVSNYPEYMQDSFNVQAFHYFPKPFREKDFLSLMELLITDFANHTTTKLLLREDLNEELVYIHDIIAITCLDARQKRLTVTLQNRSLTTSGRISDMESDLKDHNFISPSRGYLVNLNHVHYIQEKFLVMDNGEQIPLSRKKRKFVMDCFNNRLLTINH